jgi:hypothetical protein
MLVRSQAPTTARKFTAPSKAQPSASDIGADIIQRSLDQHREAVVRLQALDERDAARAIMTSPFIRVVKGWSHTACWMAGGFYSPTAGGISSRRAGLREQQGSGHGQSNEAGIAGS